MVVGHECLDRILNRIRGPILVTKFNERIPNLPFGNIWPVVGPREEPDESPKEAH